MVAIVVSIVAGRSFVRSVAVLLFSARLTFVSTIRKKKQNYIFHIAMKTDDDGDDRIEVRHAYSTHFGIFHDN